MIGNLLEELGEYGRHYASACADRARLAARKTGIYLALAAIAALAAAAFVVTAVVMVCLGLAGGIGSALDRPWLGELIVGAALLMLAGLGAWILIRWFLNASRQRTVRKYDRMQSRQREKFGHDVAGRAEAARSTESASGH